MIFVRVVFLDLPSLESFCRMYDDSQSKGTHKFIANVLGYDAQTQTATVEMRNRFKVGDELEVLSPSNSFNQIIKVGGNV